MCVDVQLQHDTPAAPDARREHGPKTFKRMHADVAGDRGWHAVGRTTRSRPGTRPALAAHAERGAALGPLRAVQPPFVVTLPGDRET